jgi:hypothetical protein
MLSSSNVNDIKKGIEDQGHTICQHMEHQKAKY